MSDTDVNGGNGNGGNGDVSPTVSREVPFNTKDVRASLKAVLASVRVQNGGGNLLVSYVVDRNAPKVTLTFKLP